MSRAKLTDYVDIPDCYTVCHGYGELKGWGYECLILEHELANESLHDEIQFFLDGNLHNTDGPATVRWDRVGKIIVYAYWIKNKGGRYSSSRLTYGKLAKSATYEEMRKLKVVDKLLELGELTLKEMIQIKNVSDTKRGIFL